MLRRSLALASLLLTVAACGSASGPDTSAPSTGVPTATSISWSKCPADDTLDCADFKVPYDYTGRTKGEFTLKLVRHSAADRAQRIGSMLVNPGGPGFGGTFIAENADSYLSQDLLDRFDVIGWDPRGTGKSTPFVDCISDYDRYFALDPTPETDAERTAMIGSTRDFTDACEKENHDILPWISTNNTARDMDRIRAALGEDRITYFGFSYGSELGATWATMFPSTVRAAVLDGAADPDSDFMQGALDQAAGFEHELTTFLAQCTKRPTCAFHNGGDAEGAFDRLMTALDDAPLKVSSDRAGVNLAVAMTAVSQAMYSSTMWTDLETALDDAQKGNGQGLLDLYDQYYQRNADGTYGNELEAFNAILCVDDPGPKTVEDMESYTPQFRKVAPRMWPSFASGYGCVFWKAKPDLRIPITGKGAGPIVVVGTTGDAATPLAGSRNMAATLEDGHLVVVTGNHHTGYGANQCVLEAVDNYLITAGVGFAEKKC